MYFGLYKIILMEEIFHSLGDCKRYLDQFFTQKDKRFWEDGITKLPEKWQNMVEQNDESVFQ